MKNKTDMPSLPSFEERVPKAPAAKQKTSTKKAAPAEKAKPTAKARKPADRLAMIAGWGVLGLVLISLLIVFSAQRRAEDITASLDKSVLKGLVVDHTFNPNTNKRYIRVSEGIERNVSVRESGTTLPVISRYNFKALTPDNYKVIGAAPWALSINVASNKNDPELLRYLLDQDDMSKSFIARSDVAPLLTDPQALAKIVANENALQAFFTDETMQEVLSSAELIEAFAGSRFMAYLLISKSAKYYRDHPQEAARLIQASPTLRTLKKNPGVRKAVANNPYLKKISSTLLK